jgi:dolichol-phosphate mannosyltransferase
MKLSIIIPVYNEEGSIDRVIGEVLRAPVTFEKEIIIVDDGSKDKTRKLLNKYRDKKNFKIIGR